jgi:hypothetical protein
MKKLPIGLSSLHNIITDDYLYIDKTKHLFNLVNSGRYYFLSRPRRFGKTLFLDTLKQAFIGNKELFKGLYLENNWDWSISHPIIHISFSSDNYSFKDVLNKKIQNILNNVATTYNISLTLNNPHGITFSELITKLHAKTGKTVVILIDEYDKPILDAIDDTPLATYNR